MSTAGAGTAAVAVPRAAVPLARRARWLHPVAWWIWAGGSAVAAMRTTNIVVLALIVASAAYVVASRKPEAPWARSFTVFLKVGVFVVVARVVLEVLFGTRVPGVVVLTVPAVDLPSWMAGVTLGGPVTLEALVSATRDGTRLATILVCFGAVNALASPYRLLRALPPVLYEVGVAVTVALSFTPELVTTLGRRRQARRLRGRPVRGLAGVRGLALPLLEGSLDRAVALAASMDTRGYGRRADADRRQARLASGATGLGLVALAVGTYGILDAGAPAALGLPVLALGSAVVAGALVLGSRRSLRTRYRPDVWRAPEWGVVACGLAPAVAVSIVAVTDPAALSPPVTPLSWPAVPPVVLVGVCLSALAGVVAPEPPLRAAPEHPQRDARLEDTP